MIWTWLAPLIVLGVLIILFSLYLLLIALVLKKVFAHRYDYNPFLKYYTHHDFPGLKQEKIHFKNKKGEALAGFIYYYHHDKYKGVITFIHGVGAGHLAYANIIEYFAKNGYIVFAYDQSGSGESEGKGSIHVSGLLNDLIAANQRLSEIEELKKYPHYIIGHSLGAYVANCSLKLNLAQPYKKVIGCSSFNHNVFDMVGNLGKFLSPGLSFLGFFVYPKLSRITVIKALNSTDKKVLLIHGTSDVLVPYSLFEKIKAKTRTKENITYIDCLNRKHQPYLSVEAEEIVSKNVDEIGKLNMFNQNHENDQKMAELASQIDFSKTITLDHDLMEEISRFIEVENY